MVGVGGPPQNIFCLGPLKRLGPALLLPAPAFERLLWFVPPERLALKRSLHPVTCARWRELSGLYRQTQPDSCFSSQNEIFSENCFEYADAALSHLSRSAYDRYIYFLQLKKRPQTIKRLLQPRTWHSKSLTQQRVFLKLQPQRCHCERVLGRIWREKRDRKDTFSGHCAKTKHTFLFLSQSGWINGPG